MPAKKLYSAWLAYLVITFVLGYLWHLVLFKDLYAKLAIFTRLEDPIVPLGFAAMVIQGASSPTSIRASRGQDRPYGKACGSGLLRVSSLRAAQSSLKRRSKG
jgi:hypothetical protein